MDLGRWLNWNLKCGHIELQPKILVQQRLSRLYYSRLNESKMALCWSVPFWKPQEMGFGGCRRLMVGGGSEYWTNISDTPITKGGGQAAFMMDGIWSAASSVLGSVWHWGPGSWGWRRHYPSGLCWSPGGGPGQEGEWGTGSGMVKTVSWGSGEGWPRAQGPVLGKATT